MSQLAQSILSQAQSLPEGGLLSPKEFLHMGSRAAIDQTLSRLAREGKLLRVGEVSTPFQFMVALVFVLLRLNQWLKQLSLLVGRQW